MEIAAVLILLVQGYGIIGAVAAVAFLLIGIDRIDEDARGSYAFRPLLIPGIIVLWPIVLVRWLELERADSKQSD
ncbi:MAG: hypothetical protein AAFV45_10000 [Pseudomonadota bacterium]